MYASYAWKDTERQIKICEINCFHVLIMYTTLEKYSRHSLFELISAETTILAAKKLPM